MQKRGKILVFGKAGSLEKPEVQSFCQALGESYEMLCLHSPKDFNDLTEQDKAEFKLLLLILDGGLAPPISPWAAVLAPCREQAPLWVLSESQKIPSQVERELGYTQFFTGPEHFEQARSALLSEPTQQLSAESELDEPEIDLDPEAQFLELSSEKLSGLTDVSLLDSSAEELSKISMPIGEFSEEPLSKIHDLSEIEEAAELEDYVLDEPVAQHEEEKVEEEEEAAPQELETEMANETFAMTFDEPVADEDMAIAPEAEFCAEEWNNQDVADFEVPSEDLALPEDFEAPSAEPDENDIDAPLLTPEQNLELPDDFELPEEPEAEQAPMAEEPSFALPDPEQEPEPASHADPDELATLKRYATLKEREAKEKELSLQVLAKQLKQTKDRLSQSDDQRRRLLVENEELKSQVLTLEEQRGSQKHHESKLESQYKTEISDLQLRLDNAQFQASKTERKLEDFRERVRSDLQRIRSRERDLANRLELHKRDSQALLAAKDERLLSQRREIDRLEFELESLSERLIENTEKAEERTARLIRALQSLKLAQGVLSEIDEEVLPQQYAEAIKNPSKNDDDSGEDAA